MRGHSETHKMPAQTLQQLNACLRVLPQNLNARLQLAQLQLERDAPEAALEALEKHDFYAPERQKDPDIVHLRASVLRALGRVEEAASILQELVSDHRDDAKTHQLLAEIALERHHEEAAITHLQKVLHFSPQDHCSLMTLIDLLYQKNPRACLDLMLEHDLDFSTPRLQRQVASLCRRFDEIPLAEDIYRRLIVQQPHDASVHLDAGCFFSEQGHNAAALHHLRQAMRLDPSLSYTCLTRLAITYMHAGRFTKAGGCWHKASQYHPAEALPWAGLLLCAQQENRRTLIQRAALRLDQRTNAATRQQVLSQMWLHIVVGIIVRQTLRPSEHPATPTASPLQAMLSHARNTLEQHAQHWPNRADTHYHLAVCQNAMGNLSQATQAAQKALQINPRYERARQLVKKLLQAA